MTKREAKIEALRIAAAMLIHLPDSDDDDRCKSIDDKIKIGNELKKLSDAMYKRATKLGGEFNQYTGY